MLFNSHIFLLLFLPLVLVGFYWIGGRLGRAAAFLWLIAASLLFYVSWQWGYLWLLLFSLVFNYGAARWVEKAVRGRAWIAGLAVVGNVVLLFYYKTVVAGLFGDSDAPAASFSTTQDVLIPLAISFITFQQIAFVMDTYHGRSRRANGLEYCLFITFFPQLVMGPIVHYRELVSQFRAPDLLSWRPDNFSLGASIFIIGLFKKVVIADSIGPYVDQIYELVRLGHEVSSADAWGASIGFQFQIYFDFSGYADMAVGLGRMFNINLPINFDSPYRAVDRFDQWRRWHISFGAFIRQYLYFPLARAKRLRLGSTGALMITTVIAGFWHGLGATFIVWGGLQGLIMAAVHYRNVLLDRLGLKRRNRKRRFPWLAMALTFLTTLLLGVFFRSSDLGAAFHMFGEMYKGIAGLTADTDLSDQLKTARLMDKVVQFKLMFMALIIWGLPNTQRFFGQHWSAIDQRSSVSENSVPDLLPAANRLRFVPSQGWAIVMTLLFLVALWSMGESSRYIYYQF